MRQKKEKTRFSHILSLKTGLNPNSSSLGANTTWLLVWSSALAIFGPVLSLAIRGIAAVRKKDKPGNT
ncbi:MAG: hypothetical protein GXP49_18335 [Deltaproteobacteria bacterium]|nr:hypothetical protein [Deltaproteobacteria bacterium]